MTKQKPRTKNEKKRKTKKRGNQQQLGSCPAQLHSPTLPPSSAHTRTHAHTRAGVQTTTRYSLAADHLVAVVLLCKELEVRLNDTTTEAEHKVECALLLNVVVAQGATVLQLLAGEDEALLIRGDA